MVMIMAMVRVVSMVNSCLWSAERRWCWSVWPGVATLSLALYGVSPVRMELARTW